MSKSGLRRLDSKGRSVLYGPVRSRRLGASLGINVNLHQGKTCTFDCVYCQYGRTVDLLSLPSAIQDWIDEDSILFRVKRRLKALKLEKQNIDSITFAGYGEPTLFPALKTLAENVKKLRNEFFPGVSVRILTNSSLVGLEDVFTGLEEFDTIIAKLDVGEEENFRAINRPAQGIPDLAEIVDNLHRLQVKTHRVTLQTLIFRSSKLNKLTNHEVPILKSIVERVRSIDPESVQIYTVARYPSEAYVQPVGQVVLEKATNMINEALGRRCAKVYY